MTKRPDDAKRLDRYDSDHEDCSPHPESAVSRVVRLASLGLVVFVVSVVIIHIALLLLAAVALSSSCGENCYTDIYLGGGFVVANLVVSLAIAATVVRYRARKRPRSRA
jgi:hypothetical protein